MTGSGSGDQAPVYSRGTTDIEVQNLTLTGSPLYGIFMRNVNNVILGQIDMRLSAGLGVRIDNQVATGRSRRATSASTTCTCRAPAPTGWRRTAWTG